jgi:hypothetical protein
MNNLALFVTHNIFLTKDETETFISSGEIKVVGHCVPVWVDAKTGKTTEPASEIFCVYELFRGEEFAEVEVIPRKGFLIKTPKSDWTGPEQIDYQKIGQMSSSDRQSYLKERDKWWFNNPKPQDIENLQNGYLRFEVKKMKQKTGGRSHSAQHVVEIADVSRLRDSLTV